MPSTYTNSLRQERQADGENDNTWGAKLNTVIDLFEESVAGFLSKNVSGSSDVTLTATNGASDESRHASHKYIGTLTGDINVVVPTQEKVILAWNATSGDFALTVKTASGSGVTVPQGEKALLVCDGTDVVEWVSQPAEVTLASLGVPLNSTTAKTGAYTVTTSDRGKLVVCDASGDAFTVSLPPAATAGDGFVVGVIKTDTTTNGVTVDGDSTETINGATTLFLGLRYSFAVLVCDGTEWHRVGTEPQTPAGSVMMYGGASAPAGWVLCDGTSLSRATYPALFAAIGTTYGAVDASHFNVPDFKGRSPLGVGQGSATAEGDTTGTNRTLGSQGGYETHTLDTSEMPSHTHSITTILANQVGGTAYGNSGAGLESDPGPFATESAGGGAGHTNMHPYLALNFIIKT